jgi:hypothetical protein
MPIMNTIIVPHKNNGVYMYSNKCVDLVQVWIPFWFTIQGFADPNQTPSFTPTFLKSPSLQM